MQVTAHKQEKLFIGFWLFILRCLWVWGIFLDLIGRGPNNLYPGFKTMPVILSQKPFKLFLKNASKNKVIKSLPVLRGRTGSSKSNSGIAQRPWIEFHRYSSF